MMEQQAAMRADRAIRDKWWEHKIYWLVNITLLLAVAYFGKGLYDTCNDLFDYYMEHHSLQITLVAITIIRVYFCYIPIKQIVIRMVRD